jgi:hypothetical protein
MKEKTFAIPLNDTHPSSVLSERFGKTPYVAFFNGHTLQILPNTPKSSNGFLQWCKRQGATHLLLKEHGRIPCACKKDPSIILCYPLTPNPTLQDAIRQYYQTP